MNLAQTSLNLCQCSKQPLHFHVIEHHQNIMKHFVQYDPRPPPPPPTRLIKFVATASTVRTAHTRDSPCTILYRTTSFTSHVSCSLAQNAKRSTSREPSLCCTLIAFCSCDNGTVRTACQCMLLMGSPVDWYYSIETSNEPKAPTHLALYRRPSEDNKGQYGTREPMIILEMKKFVITMSTLMLSSTRR